MKITMKNLKRYIGQKTEFMEAVGENEQAAELKSLKKALRKVK